MTQENPSDQIIRLSENIPPFREDEDTDLALASQYGKRSYAEIERDLHRLQEEQRRRQLDEESRIKEKLDRLPPAQQEKIRSQLEQSGPVGGPEPPTPGQSSPTQEQGTVEKTNTLVTLQLSPDRMQAILTIKPPRGGGLPPTREILVAYLKKKGVVFGIDQKKIAEAVAHCRAGGNETIEVEVAQGRAPEEGTDGELDVEFKALDPEEVTPQIRGHGPSDQDPLQIGKVDAGQVLLTLVPATPGRPGHTVLGESIPPREVYVPKIETGPLTRRMGNAVIAEAGGLAYLFQDSILVCHFADGRATVAVSDDGMQALLTIAPAVGTGRPLTAAIVTQSLTAAGITWGIDEHLIGTMVDKSEGEKITINNIPIAKGTEPEHGQDAVLEFLVKTRADMGFKPEQGGRIDYREREILINIEEGTLLAVKRPAVPPGLPGKNVFGQEVPAREGKDVEIQAGQNVETKLNAEGNTEYISRIPGQIYYKHRQLDIHPLYVVPGDLDLSLGNINFNGNILIRGNVEDGFTVKASGDIAIMGSVGASLIEAGGDVDVRGGVISRQTGSINAGGSVHARFAEYARIFARKDIMVDRVILHSQLSAGESIVCTRERGHLIGGHCIAGKMIDVKALGNENGTRTEATVGINYDILQQLKKLDRSQSEYDTMLERITLVLKKIEKIKGDGQEIPEDVRRINLELLEKKMLVDAKLHEIKMQRAGLLVEEQDLSAVRIVIRQDLWPDVKLHFGMKTLEISAHKNAVEIFFNGQENRIESRPLHAPG